MKGAETAEVTGLHGGTEKRRDADARQAVSTRRTLVFSVRLRAFVSPCWTVSDRVLRHLRVLVARLGYPVVLAADAKDPN
jgi:hypothetical protein